MSRKTLIASIPDVTPDNVQAILTAIKSTIEVREGLIGDPLDQNATLRDLVDLQVLQQGGSTRLSGGLSVPVLPRLPAFQSYDPNTDYTTPPAPTNVRAVGGLTNVYLEWDGAPFKNPSYAEVWRSFTDNLGSAIRIGTTAANVYADPARPDTTYFYWVRYVSVAQIVGPYNATSGTQAKTAFVVADAIKALSAEVQSSALFIDLGSRIGTVETSQFISQTVLDAINSTNQELSAGMATNGSAIVTLQKNNASQATSITGLGTRVGNSESTIVTLQQTTATQATSLTALTTRVGTSESSITSLQTTTASQATTLTSLGTRVGTSETNITSLQSTSATQASSLSTLSSTVGTNTTSISSLTTTTSGLSAQYTVKIDANGHVSGFGLASTVVNGTPSSAFIVRADKFAIAGATDTTNPLGTTSPTSVPFMVNTASVVIGGKTYPAGTWINTAFIANATIDNALITSLTSDKITTGNLTAAIGITTGMISGGVNTSNTFGAANYGTGFFLGLDQSVYKFRVGSYAANMTWDGTALSVTGNINATSGSFRNITIYDSSNNVILSSGGINTTTLGLGSLAYASTVAASSVTGLGSLATQSTVAASSVTGLGTLATASSVNWNTQLTNIPSFGNFAYLSSITSANISTYIAGAAIGNAYISDLNATKLTAGTIDADRLTATVINAKVTNIDAAVIGSGVFGTARINDAAITTLKIAGSAVTVPMVATGAAGQAFGSSTSVSIKTSSFSLPSGTTVTALFTSLKINYGAGDIEVILNLLYSDNSLAATIAGASTGRLIQTMGPPGDKVTATFSGQYTTTAADTYKVEAIITNPYGNSWTSEYCTVVALGAKR